MKKTILFLAFLLGISLQSWAYDFSAVAPSGQTLYYNIVDIVGGNAEVTNQNNDYENPYNTYPSGDLTIPSTVTYIGNTYSVTSIGSQAFMLCTGLTSITIPNSVTSIGSEAFRYSGLTSVTIPNSVTSINTYAFAGCSGLTSIVVESGNIKYNSRDNCNAIIETATNTLIAGCKNTTIPNSVRSIGTMAFSACTGLTSVTIPNSVTSIRFYAFESCTGLTSVTIGSHVSEIGDYAFYGCTSLTEIHSLNTVAPNMRNSGGHYSHVFYGVPSTIPVYIPCGSLASYTAYYSSVWSDWIYYFSNFIESDTISFSVVSSDNQMGTVQILTTPTCENPQAEVYASPNSGYHFDHWSDNSTSNPYTLTATEGTELIAYFAPDVTYYTVTAESADPSMGSVTGGGSYASGTTVTITASPYSGYQFDHWSNYSAANPYTLTVTEDMTLIAYFSPIGDPTTYYTITVVANDPSMGTVFGGGSYAANSTATITATATSGYHFVQWQDGNTQASRSVTVTSDATYTAYFEANAANEYTITVIPQNPSMGSTTGSGTFEYGTVTTITAEPYSGYHFVQWQDGNTQRIRTITVTGNATYTAYFDGSNSIDDVESSDNLKIYSRGNTIVIDFSGQQAAVSKQDIVVYDVMGRVIKQTADSGQQAAVEIPVATAGLYMVKIGDQPSRKVLVRP